MEFPVNIGKGYVSYEKSLTYINRSDDYSLHPAKYWIEPFKIAGNLYYVGDKQVCAHLVDTGDGLILFDSGFPQCKHLLFHSIYSLGFNPKDIKYVIHSHGHFDHIGCSEELRLLFGAKLCMSRVDVEAVAACPDKAMFFMSADDQQQFPSHDVLLEDGQVLTLGNTSILCRLAAGHTEGTMAFFFDITEGDKTYRVGYFGGVGFNTLYKEYYEPMGMPDMQKIMAETVKKLREENVDISIGNHPGQNCTIERREAMLRDTGRNPFIDTSAWTALLDAVDERLAGYAANNL